MTGNGMDYSEWFFTLSSEEQKKFKSPVELLKSLTEPVPSLNLPTSADYLNARFERDKKIFKLGETVYGELLKLSKEAELHRIDYNHRSIVDTGQLHYWHGRRDEAGHFRDRLLTLIESLGK
jgi:hypothetical protein